MACIAEVDLASAIPIEAPEVSPPSVPEVMQCSVALDLGDGARESVPEVVGHELLTTLEQELASDERAFPLRSMPRPKSPISKGAKLANVIDGP